MSIDGKKVWEGSVMPIGAYYGPIASYTDEQYGYTSEDFLKDKYFQMIADCGVNLITTVDCDYADEPENFRKTLDFCEKHQIRILVKDRGLKPEMSIKEMKDRMKPYGGYKAFAGIRIIDEPEVDFFPNPAEKTERALHEYAELSAKINSIEDMLGYVNLLPYYSSMKADSGVTIEDYQRYIDEYCKTCYPIKVISYDHYVFDFEPRDFENYFANLSIIREAAENLGIPFWAFVQCGGQWFSAKKPTEPYYPTEGEFMWNVNTCLAMGAKGIQYFPLVQPHWFSLTPEGEIDSRRSGLIGADGTETPWYSVAKKANKQICAVDEVLMQSKHKGVIALGAAEEDITKVACVLKEEGFRQLVCAKPQGIGTLIGCFDYEGKTALYVVNYDWCNTQEILLQFDAEHRLTQVSEQGTMVTTSQTLTLTLSKGEAVLLVVE